MPEDLLLFLTNRIKKMAVWKTKFVSEYLRIRKSKKSWLPPTVGGETGNKAVTVMWRKHFSALLNSSKNCGIWNFVHQNIISHGNFEGIDELMCNSYKIKSLLHKLPLNRAAGKDGIFAEHIFYADSSVCNHLRSLFIVFTAWKNSSGMYANSHCTYLQKQEWEYK